jgi:hypothetical protein
VDPQWAQEQYEHCEAYLDYLGAVQLYNKYHAKFRRRLPAWLQVLSSASFHCSLLSVLYLLYSVLTVVWSLWFLFTVHCVLC